MATIKFKRTTTATTPTGLTFGEPAFVQGLNSFYVTNNSGTSIRVGAEVDTDTTLAGAGATHNKIPTQLAVKTYVDNNLASGAVTNVSGVTGAVSLRAGTAISIAVGSGSDKGITFTNTGVQSAAAGSGISVSGSTGAVTISNTGVTGIAAGTGISVSASTGNITITNTGVQSLAGTSNQITVTPSGGTGALTLSLPSAITTPGTLTTTSDLTVGGNLIVNGTTTTVNSTTLTVEDSLVFLAKGNSASHSLDIGLYGMYDPTGTQDLYGGIFLDATDTKFKAFTGLTAAPTNVVDTSLPSFTKGTLVADVEGKVNGLSVTTSTGTLTIANSKTLTASNTLTFTGTDSSSVAFGGGGTVAYTSNNLGAFASTTSSQLAGVISDETGSGSLVFATSPTLVTPILGTPQSGTLTNCTGYPVANIANLGTGVATFLTTPTSANLISAVTDETGSGSLVFATSPTLVTPTLGVASATSINKVAITAPATSATLTIADGKTLTASNTLTFTGTDGSSVAFGAGGTVVYTSNKLSVHASTTSAELAGVISDETGSGSLVFATSPTLVTPVLGVATATSINGFAIQNAAADSTTKGLAAFTTNEFTASSGVISIGVVDGGSY